MKIPSKDLIILGWHHAKFIIQNRDDKTKWDVQASILKEHAKECPGC